ncbi:MAG: polyisoprenyl-teichoic acid--peptidoglycan teichoic acid transferase [Solirubrobacteraceae bacterium]|nr:polyisoprenyl-teichoic acid--peptidoglycan teichoic acid transferase [Solirubrobacteraceae bacterium]
MSVYEPEGPPRLGWGMIKRFALGSIVIVLLSATAVASAILLQVHDAINILERASTPIPGVKNVLDDVPAGDPQTILILGSDRRFGDGKGIPVRSDTLILMRLDPNKGATAIMSLPRDLKVDIPGYGSDKINAAYAEGGPKLTVRTVRELLGIPINHVINVNFHGFQLAVNRLGCVYADVDRRYYNTHGGPGGYATIDIKPGYQKLCGSDALDYVRYRHTDNDLVRAARQQDFLRQAKGQIGLGKVFGNRNELLRIFGHYTQTDIAQSNDAAILRLIRLAYDSSKTPLTEIQFPAQVQGDYLDISIPALQKTVDRFIQVKANGKKDQGSKPKPKTVKAKRRLAPGLILAKTPGEDHVLNIAVKLRTLPVYFPKAILARGGYVRDSPRAYTIRDRNKNPYKAYRIVLSQGDDGQYYGVQGTTWKAAPILDSPTDEIKMRKRTYQRYFDGRKIRMIAWKTPKAVYWVSNTLTRNLTNRQMMDIARSLQRIGQ